MDVMIFFLLLGSLDFWVDRRRILILNKDVLEFYIWFFLFILVENNRKERDKK